MKKKNEYPTMSRKDHNKRSDSPKGGKIAPLVLASIIGAGAGALQQGQQAEQSLEEGSKARMRAGMKNKVVGN